MAKYVTKESIEASGFENAVTIPYKGKALQKKFSKGEIFEGIENNSFGENAILTDENPATNTIDLDTKLPYKGKAQFALDPSKVEKISESQTVTQELQTKKQESILSKISGAYGKNLLIAGAVVLGYLAYKKFKK